MFLLPGMNLKSCFGILDFMVGNLFLEFLNLSLCKLGGIGMLATRRLLLVLNFNLEHTKQ